jgi:hypothetical protein
MTTFANSVSLSKPLRYAFYRFHDGLGSATGVSLELAVDPVFLVVRHDGTQL